MAADMVEDRRAFLARALALAAFLPGARLGAGLAAGSGAGAGAGIAALGVRALGGGMFLVGGWVLTAEDLEAAGLAAAPRRSTTPEGPDRAA
jgi:hypothetical protein